MRLMLSAVCSIPLILTGCALSNNAASSPEQGAAIGGMVHGGQQPVVGAHVYLLAASTTGYGTASTSLLNSTTGTSDTIGNYVLTGSTGAFNITSTEYSCTPGSQVYAYALGGNPGAGTNSAAGLLAVLGNCPSAGSFIDTIPFISMNEVSTVAAAYAFAGFATDATHVGSSGTTLAQADITTAFANAFNLVDLPTGYTLTTSPAYSGTVPTAKINTIGNILASCINSAGPSSSNCTTLFSNAMSAGTSGTAPTDTATAAIYLAHNPGNPTVATALYGLQNAAAPFAPSLTAAPNDFTLGIQYTSGINGPEGIAADAFGDIWVTNTAGNTVTEFTNSTSAVVNFANSSLNQPVGIAMLNGNAWIANSGGNNLLEITANGTAFNYFTDNSVFGPKAVAIDPSGNVWVADTNGTAVSKFSSSGTFMAVYTGGGIQNPSAIAFDHAGNAWITNGNGSSTVTELSNSGAVLSGTNGYSQGGISNPLGVAIDASNAPWVVNAHNDTITKITGPTTANSYSGGGLGLPFGIAFDGLGNAWVANAYSNGAVSEFSSAGTPLSSSTGFGPTANGSAAIAVDGSGDVWVANETQSTVTQFIGAAAPVVTPIAAQVANNTFASRP